MSDFKSSIDFDRVYVLLWGENFLTHPGYQQWRDSVEANPTRMLRYHLADLWERFEETKSSNKRKDTRNKTW